MVERDCGGASGFQIKWGQVCFLRIHPILPLFPGERGKLGCYLNRGVRQSSINLLGQGMSPGGGVGSIPLVGKRCAK